MTSAVAVIVDVSVVTAVALLVCRALHRRPAALRHMVLVAAMAAVAAIPVLETTVPNWDVPMLASASAVTSSGLTMNSESPSPLLSNASNSRRPELTWSLGARCVGDRFHRRDDGPAGGTCQADGDHVALSTCSVEHLARTRGALSREHGLTRSVVVLESRPAAAPDVGTVPPANPRTCRRPLLDHWTHRRRPHPRTRAHRPPRLGGADRGSECVRAVHWFNPLVWTTSRRLRDESEQACDDAVLRRGLKAVDYASHLLAVARHVAADGLGGLRLPPWPIPRRSKGELPRC